MLAVWFRLSGEVQHITTWHKKQAEVKVTMVKKEKI